MATEAAIPVNGNYGATSHTSSQSANLANGAGSESTPAPQTGKDEVGWYFVEQYYTTMSRSPEKVHLFYNKRSQFVYGVEAEKVPVSVGQKAINERIAELGIEDCKVRVTNVDSQESGKSIILQVIGEMSVKGQPHRKFAQTFVLAEQPNGYFVLNDIFRYIADEPDEDEEEVEPAADAPVNEFVQPQELPKTLSSSPNPAEQAQSAEIVNKKLEEVADEEPTIQATSVQDPVVTEAGPVDEPEAPEEAPEADVKSVGEPALEPEKPKDPEPTPSATPAPAAAQAAPPKEAAPAPAPAPAKPAVPKTWASMLAGSKAPPAVPVVPAQTNNAPSQPKAAPTAAPTAPSAPAAQAVQAAQAAPAAAQAAVAETQAPSNAEGWQTAGSDHNKKQSRSQQPGNISGYIKNVSEKFFDNNSLKQHISQYGKITYFDISRQKNCAFVEFESPAGYNAAVAANPHKILGEEIIVEERRRAGMVGNNFRGGPRGGRGGPGGRGGFAARGRGGPGGRGRGGAPDA